MVYVSAAHLVLTSYMLVLTIVTVLQFCKLRYKMLVRPINLIFDIVSRMMSFCKLYAHQVIVCTRNLNPRLKAKLDRNYPHQNDQTAPLALYYQIDLIP